MQCPLCEASCAAELIGAVTLDRCAGCRALWFDRTELAGAFNARVPGVATDWGQPLPTSVEEGPLCPRTAGIRLRGYTWLGERFWRCPTCKGVLMTAAAWQGMLVAAERQLLDRQQRVTTLDGVQVIVEILGAGFA
jgi:Zn-finger nucleic acid-binding protein